MGNRHKSREFTLQILYAIDISENPPRRVVDLFWETLTSPDEVREFSNQLVFGVHKNLKYVDEIIARYSEHWAIDRMTSVDRNILRMAVFELLFIPEIPHSVTINEAVEIGKKFGSEDSGAFVNGILDKIAKEGIENLGSTTEAPAPSAEVPHASSDDPTERKVSEAPFSDGNGGNGGADARVHASFDAGDGMALALGEADDEALLRQRLRRAAIAKAATSRKLPVGAKITIRKGNGS